MKVGILSKPVRGLCVSFFSVLSTVLFASALSAQTIVTFDEYGTVGNPPDVDNDTTIIIDSEYQTGGADNTSSPLPPGFGFSVTTAGGSNSTGDITLYDTSISNGNDPDLENLIDGDGNPANYGNIIISQDGDGPGTGYVPDDHVNATLTIDFETPVTALGWNLADIDAGTTFTLTDSNGATLTFSAGDSR